MTAYETGRYDMFKRVCKFGETYQQLFPAMSDAGKTFALVAHAIDLLDGYDRDKRHAKEHSWRHRRQAREALLDRLRQLARIATDEARRHPGADAMFPPPVARGNTALLQLGRLYIQECAHARALFLRLGMPDSFIEDLKALVATFEASMHRGWNRRITLCSSRVGSDLAFAKGFDAVRTLDLIVANTLANEPTLLALWKDIRRNESRRKTTLAPLARAASAQVSF